MKKLILGALVAAFMSAIPISGFAAKTIDITHLDLDPRAEGKTLGCAECHFSTDPTTGLEMVASDQCGKCHKIKGGIYDDGNAPLVQSHKELRCSACHNPHVSLQYQNKDGMGKTPLVKGNITGKTQGTGSITFNITVDAGYPWSTADDLWDTKTTAGRGLIMWVKQPNGEASDCATTEEHDERLDNFSFEVTDANATLGTITVNDRLNLGPSLINLTAPYNKYELHYGQLIARAVYPNHEESPFRVDYTSANATVDEVVFPATGNTGALEGNFFVTADGKGICQKCHRVWNGLTGQAKIGTKFWDMEGGGQTHNPDKVCTTCHNHSSDLGPTYGFGLGDNCQTCHPTYGNENDPNYGNPPNSGAHMIHAGKDLASGQYGFDCQVCHKGGMTKWALNERNDDLVTVGFNLIPNGTINFSGANTYYDGNKTGTGPDPENYGLGYSVYNDTKLGAPTNWLPPAAPGVLGGSFRCSNIYCHSDGYAAGYWNHSTSTVSKPARCTTSTASSRSWATKAKNITPSWYGSFATDTLNPDDGNKCNNCHDVTSQTNQSTTVAGYTVHRYHVNSYLTSCASCHAATAEVPTPSEPGDRVSSTGIRNHANGYINVKSPTGNMLYDPNTYSCSNWAGVSGVSRQGVVQGCHIEPSVKLWKNLNNNANATDNITCETVAASPNVDPIAPNVGTCYNISANSFVFETHSYDVDYLDPVKAASYGGHDGSKMWYLLNWHNTAGNIWESKFTKDYPDPTVLGGFSFSDAYMANPSNQGTGWLNYVAIDNNANSFNNLGLNVSPNGGWKRSGWQACEFGTYPAAENEVPMIAYTTSTVNSTTMRITDLSYDKDWNTTPSNPSWTGIDKNAINGCGNDGANARFIFVFLDDHTVGYSSYTDPITLQPVTKTGNVPVYMPLTGSPTNFQIEHTFSPTNIFGTEVWFNYVVQDTNGLLCGSPSRKSGWKKHNLQ